LRRERGGAGDAGARSAAELAPGARERESASSFAGPRGACGRVELRGSGRAGA
jgi:hypothetical protein